MDWKDLDVHHIGIVVDDIETAKKPYEDVFGLEVVEVFDVEPFAAKVAFLPVKNTYIELVQPTNPDDGLGKFLERGGGMHHICYEVEDLDAVYENLTKQNIRSVTGPPQRNIISRTLSILYRIPVSTSSEVIRLISLITWSGELPASICKSRSLMIPTMRSFSTTTSSLTPWRLMASRASKASVSGETVCTGWLIIPATATSGLRPAAKTLERKSLSVTIPSG